MNTPEPNVEAGTWPLSLKEEYLRAQKRVELYRKIRDQYMKILINNANPFPNHVSLLNSLCRLENNSMIQDANEMILLQNMELDGIIDQVQSGKKPGTAK